MDQYSTVSPITQRLVQVHVIVKKITGVNVPYSTVSPIAQRLVQVHV